MAVPFPATGHQAGYLRYTPIYALKNLAAGAEIIWFNQNSLVGMKGSVTSNDGTNMVLNVPALPTPTFTVALAPEDHQACLPICAVV